MFLSNTGLVDIADGKSLLVVLPVVELRHSSSQILCTNWTISAFFTTLGDAFSVAIVASWYVSCHGGLVVVTPRFVRVVAVGIRFLIQLSNLVGTVRLSWYI